MGTNDTLSPRVPVAPEAVPQSFLLQGTSDSADGWTDRHPRQAERRKALSSMPGVTQGTRDSLSNRPDPCELQ